ncbi:MAG: bifunctional methylenetetrahydrofolate dehydrogenase/methenyltetrahydrofolate cyclohydrolase FolD [Thermovirgaceae bacterium]|nr:bifunctional methylenetetrahydrofolate dehydrogenase/methenyltetrahydrofolate cyclohydrolase FolD [Thermovirgaceae bacterium]
MAQLLDGKETAREIREELKTRCAVLKGKGVTPGLAVVLVGNDPASAIYVGQKEKACGDVGFSSFRYALPASATEKELLDLIGQLNADTRIHGILVQLPLPKGLSVDRVIGRIDPGKDVDGFHPLNAGRLACGLPGIVPCTPKGVMRILERYAIPLEGRNAVVVGRSNIVGKPMAHLLLGANMTVTICHSRTPDLGAETRRADLIIVAAGRPGIVDGSMVKEGAVVVDVGIHRTAEGIVGDVKFEDVAEKASWITPVPGGVGPLTIAMLLENTLELAERAGRKE